MTSPDRTGYSNVSERMARIQLARLQAERVAERGREAADAGDEEGLRAAEREMDVITGSMRSLREEQLMEELERAKPDLARASWWRFWR